MDIGKQHIGAKAVVIANTASHGSAIGRELTVRDISTDGKVVFVKETGSSYYQADLKLKSVSREEIVKNIEWLKQQLEVAEAKIAYLDDTKQEEADDEEFRAYQVLVIVENSKSSRLEKAKQIASIFKN